jgi:hypothetical protein
VNRNDGSLGETRQKSTSAIWYPASLGHGLQYFADRSKAVREVYRVLKPDGRFVALVWRAIVHSPGFTALAGALERHVSPAARAVMQAPFVFGDATEELRTLLLEADLHTVRIHSDVRMVRFAPHGDRVGSKNAGYQSAPFRWIIGERLAIPTVIGQRARDQVSRSPECECKSGQRPGCERESTPFYELAKVVRTRHPPEEPARRNLLPGFTGLSQFNQDGV